MSTFKVLTRLFTICGCWHFAQDPLKKKCVRRFSVGWCIFILINILCHFGRSLKATQIIGLSFVFLAYQMCYYLHILCNFSTLSISCFRKKGLHYILDKLNADKEIYRYNKGCTYFITSLIVTFCFLQLTSNLLVPFFVPKYMEYYAKYYSSYVPIDDSNISLYVMIVYDGTVAYCQHVAWIGLPALQTCISFYFYQEFKRLFNELVLNSLNGQLYQSDCYICYFSSKYMSLGKTVKEVDSIFSYSIGLGFALQIPSICFTFYQIVLSPCADTVMFSYFLSSVLQIVLMTTMASVMESEVCICRFQIIY